LIAKLEEKITELDGIHNDINAIYSSGAVEGYSEEKLGTRIHSNYIPSLVGG